MEALTTWIWQGSAVALTVAIALRVMPALSAATRYALWWIAMAAVLILPLVGYLLDAGAPTAAVGALPTTIARAAGLVTLPAPPAALVAGLFALWGGAVVFGVGRLVRDLQRLCRWKARCRPIPAEHERRLSMWRVSKGHGRRARLAVSDDGLVASVLGLCAPMIVVPRVLMDNLTDAELDQIVAHEHAHVQRRDDWANLAQIVIAVPFGLHPAVWVINRALRREREIAADDWVVSRSGHPRCYARCLARVASMMTWRTAPRLASAASGSRGEVARRVERLLDPTLNRSLRAARSLLVAATCSVVAGAVQLAALQPVVAFDGATASRGLVPTAPAPPIAAGWPATTSRTLASIGPRFVDVTGTGAVLTRPDTERRATEHVALVASRLPPELAGLTAEPPVAAVGLVARGWRGQPLQAWSMPSAGLQQPVEGPRESGLVPPAERHAAAEPAETATGWGKLSKAGASIGVWFSGAGQATADVFSDVGSSFKGAFTRGS